MFLTIGAGFAASKSHYSLWTSGWLIVAYTLAGVSLVSGLIAYLSYRKRDDEPREQEQPDTAAFQSFDQSVQEIEDPSVQGFGGVARSYDKSRQSIKNPRARRNQTPEDS